MTDTIKNTRKIIIKLLKEIKASDIKIKQNYFQYSGFFTYENNIFYLSSRDERNIKTDLKKILIRTAKNYKDFLGGYNNFIDFTLYDIETQLKTLLEKLKK
jgi:hypothetical protein